MSRSSDAKWEDYFQLPNPGLVTYFDRVRKGNDEEYRTTFYQGRKLKEILREWKPSIDSLERRWPSLVDFENDLAKKVGPLSIQKPLYERLDDIDSYYTSILLDAEPISESAVAAVKREWSKIGRLELRSEMRTVENMRLSTNSGSPYFTKRRAVTGKTVPCTLNIKEPEVVQQLVKDTYLSAAVLGWRGQEGGPTDEDVKQRVVWMFPLSVNIRELQFYQPAIELAQKHNLVPAWVSMESVDQSITKLFDTKDRKDCVVCTDFSKFDQHFNSAMQKCARTVISHMLNKSSTSREWLTEVFPIKYMIPLAYDDRKIRRGPHGMGSGSGGTNFDETLSHRALQYECAQSEGRRLNPYSQCLGDDGILSFPGITVESVLKTYTSHGQEMNPDKQSVSTDDCTYLRRWHHKSYREHGVCVGVYSTYRALGRLCEQERFYDPEVWGPKMVALRQLSIIENCKYHPLRDEFLRFCMKGDKYRLGLDIPGFLDNIQRYANEAIDYMPDFLGYSRALQQDELRTGINNWWVVQRLKSFA